MELYANLNKYKAFIIGIILIVIVIIITYYFTKNVRTNKKINKMNNKYPSTVSYQIDYCNTNLTAYKLVDFHVSSSTNTFMVGLSVGDYISIKMLENVLYYGTRYIELEIFNSDGQNSSTPVISYGVQKGNWITSYNTINALEVFKFIADYAFSERFISNYMDPLFIFLDIKTNNNTKTLDNLYDIILSTCNHYLLEKRYLNENINLARVSVCDLMKKVIFFSNTGYEKSKLANLISMSTKGPYLQRILHSDIVSNNITNDLNAPEISIDNNTISFKNDYLDDYIEIADHNINFIDFGITTNHTLKIDGSNYPKNNTGLNLIPITQVTKNKLVVKKSFKSEKAGKMIRLRFYNNQDISEKTLTNRNKKTLTIVIPDEKFMPTNYSPRDAWYSGCQFAAINFQIPDNFVVENFNFFNNACIKLKIGPLRNKQDILDTTEQQEGLRTFPKTIQEYNINYDFLTKYLETEIYITTLLGPNIRLGTDIPFKKNSNIHITIDYDSSNTMFKIVNGLSKAKNTISFRVLDPNVSFKKPYYLCVDPETKKLVVTEITDNIPLTQLSIEEKKQYTKSMSKYNKLVEHASFLPLNAISSDPEINKSVESYVSLGIVLNNNTNNNKFNNNNKNNVLDNLKTKLYYVKYNPGYNPKDVLYTKNQRTLQKIMTISNTANKEINIWRPIREEDFYPLGDYISVNDDIVQHIHTFSDSSFANYIFTVKGGVEKPIDYERIWTGVKNESTSNDMVDENWISIWKPVPPEGYTSLGFVFEDGKTKPNVNIVRCVKTSLLDEAPNEMFMTYIEDLKGDFSYESEVTAMKNKFKMYKLMWNNKYTRDNPLIELNPPSRSSIRPLGIWGLNLVDKSNVVLFNYYIPYEMFINNGKTIAPPIQFNYPIFIKKKNIYSKDEIVIDNYIDDESSKKAVCFKVNNIYAEKKKKINKQLESELAELKLFSGNIVSTSIYTNNPKDRISNEMCLTLPNSYWSNAYRNRFDEGVTPILLQDNLKFATCYNDNNFGSQWVNWQDETIRLVGNTNYCLTAATELNKKKEIVVVNNLDDIRNNVTIQKCEPGSIGQRFTYKDNKLICSNPNGPKKEQQNDVLYWSLKDNNVQIVNSNLESYRTHFNFNSLPEQYCYNIPISSKLHIKSHISRDQMNINLKQRIYGSNILILYKIPRVKKPHLPLQIIPETFDNPLKEEFDTKYFHVYLRGCILYENPQNNSESVFIVGLNSNIPPTIEKTMQLTINPSYLEYDYYEHNGSKINVGTYLKLLQVKKDYTSMILQMPVESKNILKPGTMVLCPNGDFNSIDSSSPNYIPHICSCYLAKVIKPIVTGNSKEVYEYEVIFSINGTEPNTRYKSFERPDFCNTTIVNISNIYLYRTAPIC